MQSSSQGVPVRADEDLWISPTCASSVPQTKAPKMKSTTYPIRSDVLFAEISPAIFVAGSRVMQDLNEQTLAKAPEQSDAKRLRLQPATPADNRLAFRLQGK